MKKIKKTLLTLACAGALVVGTASATLAYLTSEDAAVNTFTVGNVEIILDEADVNADGTVVEGADRVKANAYHLLPGHTYVKDPTVTVLANSEDSFVRMLVKAEDIAQLENAFPVAEYPDFYVGDIFLLQMLCVDENGGSTWNNDSWHFVGVNEDGSYEFRYYENGKLGIVEKNSTDNKLPALFEAITVPGSIDNDNLACLDSIKIKVVAQAIQADGFDADSGNAFAELPAVDWENVPASEGAGA